MLFGDNRDQLRLMYVETWRKHREGLPLQPLEAQLADVIAVHPEYHALLADPEASQTAEFGPDSGTGNPFLHMGMHMALREQVATDRPAGIAALHRRLSQKLNDPHAAEHAMMECLGAALWNAQRAGVEPDEGEYLGCLRSLIG